MCVTGVDDYIGFLNPSYLFDMFFYAAGTVVFYANFLRDNKASYLTLSYLKWHR